MGKTNLLEAVAYLALLESFRGAPSEAMIRSGCDTAVVRGTVRTTDREQLIEAELVAVRAEPDPGESTAARPIT